MDKLSKMSPLLSFSSIAQNRRRRRRKRIEILSKKMSISEELFFEGSSGISKKPERKKNFCSRIRNSLIRERERTRETQTLGLVPTSDQEFLAAYFPSDITCSDLAGLRLLACRLAFGEGDFCIPREQRRFVSPFLCPRYFQSV